jgi:hypothetical protein
VSLSAIISIPQELLALGSIEDPPGLDIRTFASNAMQSPAEWRSPDLFDSGGQGQGRRRRAYMASLDPRRIHGSETRSRHARVPECAWDVTIDPCWDRVSSGSER